MRFKVELHKDVVWFIRHVCSVDERREFQDRLDRLRDDPIAGSDLFTDAKISRRGLRWFRFGEMAGVFRLDLHREKIVVCECHRLRGNPDPGHRTRPAA